MTTEPGQIDLYEFLNESELQHYYNSFKNDLKIKSASQFKYATDEDLKQIGLSRPEIRRLRKYYEKYYPHGYFSKIKRLLQTPAIVKRDDGSLAHTTSTDGSGAKTGNSPSKAPNNKHIIPADSICVNKQLGTGEFGIVQQGVWTNGTERIQVAIKCLCRERMQSNPMEFLKEAAIMHSIEHENIVRLYGVVLATDSLMLVTELAHLRSLLECLKDSGLRVSFLTIPTLCEFAQQICNGMKYLENKRLIHRDLAARNILVFSKNKVKISDFGLSRALGVGKDYYKTNFNVNLKLPIAWCAPECINYLRFTNASDVWAYGVCLWEMFSYGFQPWAALTGLQILEAIDEPNYQRLEQPDCCPRDFYNLMMKCWQHDPLKRPKFSDIHEMLLELKPEQLKTTVNSCEPKKDHLMYRQGEIITVLDRNTNTPFWRGVLNSGKTGYFNPANTIPYVETPPNTNRESFYRTNERCSKRKLRTEMISRPQNDFKHTGHIGIDGESFGDVAFLGNSQSYNHLPRQVVTPYKPSEDIEQTPLLLPPTPTSPDSLQTASGYFPEEIRTSSSTNPTFVSSNENTPNHHNTFGAPSFDFSSTSTATSTAVKQQSIFHSSTNPFASESAALSAHARATASSSNSSSNSTFALQNNNYGLEANAFTNANLEDDSLQASSGSNIEDQHEYHEISDDEITADKVFDMGPSLLDEINSMFGTITASAATGTTDSLTMSKSPDFDHGHKKGEHSELSSKLNRKNSGDSNGNKSKKKSSTSGTMKPISVKDEKILNHAIEIANEISARSMTDLVSDQPTNIQSPKRKFSFRFPHLSHHGVNDKHNAGPSSGYNGNAGTLSHSKEKKNFTEELKNIPDLQRFRSLSEIETFPITDIRIPIFDKEASDFFFEKSRQILSRPINIDFRDDIDMNESRTPRDVIGENLLDIENTLKALNLDFIQTYTELDKTDSAETLLNEKFANIVSSLEGEISSASTAAGSFKSSGVYDLGGGVHTKFDFNSATSHLDKHLQHYSEIIDKIEDKRSSTPDTGFASRETNLSLSRRSSQKSSYSPQDSYFSPKDISFSGSSMEARGYMSVKNELATNNCTKINSSSSPVKNVNTSNTSIYSHSQMQNSPLGDYSGSRQRSMSFTDNYNLKSPVLSEPQHRSVGQTRQANFAHRSSGSFRNKAGGNKNSITEEGREAYNSLIERKSSMTFISKLDTDEFEMTTAKTLPRRSVHLRNEVDVLAMETSLRNPQGQLTVPLQDAPRPMTLPNRGFNGKLRKSELITNPKFFPLKQRPKTLAGENDENAPVNSNSCNQSLGSDKECESPSYLTNTFYTFPDKASTEKTNGDGVTTCADQDQTDIVNSNPIPLPPRDRNKVIKTNPKRHVRKHPLIIPAYGVQRTLNKVTEITPDDEPKIPFPGTSSNKDQLPTIGAPQKGLSVNLRKFTHEAVSAVVRPTSRPLSSSESPVETRTYQNLQEIHRDANEANIDSASLQFESILEDDFNQVDTLSSPDVTDGFYNFSIQKEQYNKSKEVDFDSTKISGLYVNEDELRNLDIEKKKVPFASPKPARASTSGTTATVVVKTTTTGGSSNELAGHALFNKIRESVDMAMSKSQSSGQSSRSSSHHGSRPSSKQDVFTENQTEEEKCEDTPAPGPLVKDSNSVSCEDLLEFSDKKPKGCERGVDSDEVRIMMKVLGKDSTPTRCLHVLEFIDWDVHKAIKLIKLQNILNTIDLSLTESVEALQKYDWDLHNTALKLKGHK